MATCTVQTGETLDCKISGGARKVYVADFANVGTPTVTSGVIATWTAAANKFFVYNVRPETAEAKAEVQQNDANGTAYFMHTVNMVTYILTSPKNQEFQRLAANRVVIIVEDRNSTTVGGAGKYWVYGFNNGLVLTGGGGGTGKAMADKNGYDYTFTGGQENMPIEYTGSISSLLA
jgi:hypothetical protein